MKLVFVHGWSVTHTDTYGDLPQSLAAGAAARGISLDIQHIHLGKYISFHDEVTLDDIARGLNKALEELPGNEGGLQPFSCLTHSTGGPVVRHWVDKYYGARKLSQLPLEHLVMLAPANHGSSLAILGKKRLGRIKSWFNGVEPGQRVLDWLCLGSHGQWQLNEGYLSYNPAKHGFYPFVLTGQGIDTKFYDFLNAYLVEPGSDGVVRAAGANLNCRYLALTQTEEALDSRGRKLKLAYNENRPLRSTRPVPMGVFSRYSHSGRKMGIMAVKKSASTHAGIVDEIVRCLGVGSEDDYKQRASDLQRLTTREQQLKPVGKKDKISRYSMLVFRVRDQFGDAIPSSDFDILMLAGEEYSPAKLPVGFFVDKQLNHKSHSLVYYVDADKMTGLKDQLYGLRVTVRPSEGFSFFVTGEFRSAGIPEEKVFAPNETTYIDITINRQVDRNVFRFDPGSAKRQSFKKTRPGGSTVD